MVIDKYNVASAVVSRVASAAKRRLFRPLLKFEWVRWWWGASGGRGQGRAKPGAANP